MGLDRRAAQNIIDHRDGPDGIAGTGDDDLFDDITELDGARYLQVRMTFVNDVAAGSSASLETLGIAFFDAND